ncbi:NAD(P)H-hydrate dehydratase [Chromatocurvus halotolerans]|uniref:Bifunctional NAD(P)H-hydrate repair enzyme n=1 Tax=Chromatocurvus halotolerans TaxID=1132028 RepID=A0A4R2KPJ4_9GAMM|nr:NAD(P)H-hydrate dehydratase [Chromatocurvus halotolerans]TCO74682.1 NAD(P)H-hydrate epimerase [Chromatocurvus halotolerans]
MPTDLLYTAEQTRLLDASAIENAGIPGRVLMSRAAAALHRCLVQRWPEADSVHVIVGTGNNGGDGWLLAERVWRRGGRVTVYQLGDPDRIRGDALRARQMALDSGVPSLPWRAGCLHNATGLIVDAMLGTGLGGEVRGDAAAAIADINASGLPVLAVDVPSGLCADSGRRLGASVVADVTLSFIGRKRGLYTLDGPDCAGERLFDDLDVPASVLGRVPSAHCWQCLDLDTELEGLAPRAAASHKGRFGQVLVVGGDHGMGGAAILAAEAALRSGAGLVRVATRPAHLGAVLARTPEAMAAGVDTVHELVPLLEASSVVLVGPGMGTGPWAQQLLLTALDSGKPLVLDADALNLLSADAELTSRLPAGCVITPHPGEAGRLLGGDSARVQADRFAAAEALSARFAVSVLLKGNGSLVVGPEGDNSLCCYGNPGMASGGMGDVLGGVIAALMAQGLTATAAARLGACVHGAAADAAAGDGQRGLLASDLLPLLRRLLG